MLTTNDIRFMLEELAWETLDDEKTPETGLRVQRRSLGYSQDKRKGTLQARLSVMLQAAVEREERAPSEADLEAEGQQRML